MQRERNVIDGGEREEERKKKKTLDDPFGTNCSIYTEVGTYSRSFSVNRGERKERSNSPQLPPLIPRFH